MFGRLDLSCRRSGLLSQPALKSRKVHLVGLAYTTKALVTTLEEGKLPPRMTSRELAVHLTRMCDVLDHLLDRDLFPWLDDRRQPTEQERARASTIIADRLCGAQSDPIIRNAQEQRQLAYIESYLNRLGYRRQMHPATSPLADMQPGTYAFRMNVIVGDALKINIPIDVVIQPKSPAQSHLPILIEAKSAGDFTNTNKRRKEEARKVQQLTDSLGNAIRFFLFRCGYFDTGYLGYEAAEGIDWIWEHRIDDMEQLGLGN
jgi:XamI restriction endonuclease